MSILFNPTPITIDFTMDSKASQMVAKHAAIILQKWKVKNEHK